MPLKLKLKPNEEIVINGCILQNDNRRHTLTIKNFANVVRGHDLLKQEEATTPTKGIYFAIQTMLIEPGSVDSISTEVQKSLGELYCAFANDDVRNRIMEAATFVSGFDYYKALVALRQVITYEEKALSRLNEEELAGEAAQ
jgi:flagellar protein FlbT